MPHVAQILYPPSIYKYTPFGFLRSLKRWASIFTHALPSICIHLRWYKPLHWRHGVKRDEYGGESVLCSLINALKLDLICEADISMLGNKAAALVMP